MDEEWISYTNRVNVDELQPRDMANFLQQTLDYFNWSRRAVAGYLKISQPTFTRWLAGRENDNIVEKVKTFLREERKPQISENIKEIIVQPSFRTAGEWAKNLTDVKNLDLLTDQELIDIWKKLGWSQRQFTSTFGLRLDQFSKWLRGGSYNRGRNLMLNILANDSPPIDIKHTRQTGEHSNFEPEQDWRSACNDMEQVSYIVIVDGDNLGGTISDIKKLNPIFGRIRVISVYNPLAMRRRTQTDSWNSVVLTPFPSKDAVDEIIGLITGRLDNLLNLEIPFFILSKDHFVKTLLEALKPRICDTFNNGLVLWTRTVYPYLTKGSSYQEISDISSFFYDSAIATEFVDATYAVLQNMNYPDVSIVKDFIESELEYFNLNVSEQLS